MCLILFANEVHPRYRLVVAANRDEFYERPTAPATWWADEPSVLAGRDLRSGGTWMGVTRGGRFAAVTNFREPGRTRDDAPSRGGLVLASLTDDRAPSRYLGEVETVADAYNGFNLLAGDRHGLWVFSNRDPDPPRQVESGIFGLSNHLLDTPWPKVARGRGWLEDALTLESDALTDHLLELLVDRAEPPDGDLPDTGVGLEMERLLAPAFIVTPVYGTRASYVVLLDRSGEITFVEQTFDEGRPSGDPRRFRFKVGS